MKTYNKLPIPRKSAWDRKSYDPILWIYKRFGNPEYLDGIFDLYFIPKEFIVNLFKYIRNVIRWSPTLYRDRDWDGHFIYEVIKQKLIHQRKELVKSNRHTLVWQQNRDITICLNLIERIQSDYYSMEYLDYCENRWWFEPTDEEDEKGNKMHTMKSVNVVDNLDHFLKKYKLDTNLIVKKRNIDLLECEQNYKKKEMLSLYVSDYREEKAKSLLFKILSDRIDWWWD
jgi:hypothetical protein